VIFDGNLVGVFGEVAALWNLRRTARWAEPVIEP
jgi:hypothetical protein